MTATGTRDGYIWQEQEGDMAALPTGGILYTPRIEAIEELRPALFSGGCCDDQYRFPEAYVFDAPPALSPLCEDNVFVAGIGPQRVFRFVAFLGFRLSATDAMKDVTDLLWTQIAWMRPRAYIAAGEGRAYWITRNDESA